MRHSASHVMADAVTRLFPDAKLAIGPPTADGFYYDFLLPRSFTPEDLEAIDAHIRQTIDSDLPFVYEELSREEALRMFAEQPFKLEIIEELPEDEAISIYRHGEFTDLCQGPHVASTGKISAYKLLNVAGAYWRGDERRPMLQRIYGTAFETAQALDDHLARLEEAQRRDHRRLGRELDLLSFHEDYGPGLAFWHPKGGRIRSTSSRTSGAGSTTAPATSWSFRRTSASPRCGRPAVTWTSTPRTCTRPWTWTARTTT